MTTITSSVPFPAPSVARMKMSAKPRPGKMPPGAASKFVPGQAPPSIHNRLASKSRPNNLSLTPPGASSDSAVNGISTNASKLNERRKAAARAVDGGTPVRPIGRPKKSAVSNDVNGTSGSSSPQMQKTKIQPAPLVLTTDYILQKYKNVPPSIVVQLHPTHFRLAGQDGGFQYTSPLKLFLEALVTETIPSELIDVMNEQGVKYYEGRLIVQVHDLRVKGETAKSEEQKDSNFKLGSLNNYNNFITPSPFNPFPTISQTSKQNSGINGSSSTGSSSKPDSDKNKQEVRIFTTVLHPSTSTLQVDIAGSTMPIGPRGAQGSKPSTPIGGSFSRVSTPLSAHFPKTPLGRTRLTDTAAAQLESQALVLDSGSLILTPATCPEHAAKIVESLRDPAHSAPPPKPKTRKRTHAEMAADEKQAADDEKLLLIMDEIRQHSITSSAAQGPRSAVPDDSESQLKKFKLMKDLKAKMESKKKDIEKQRTKSISEVKVPIRGEVARELVLKRQKEHEERREALQQAAAKAQSEQRVHASRMAMEAPPIPQGSPAIPNTQAPKPPPVQTSVAPKQNVPPPPKTPMTPLQAQTPVIQNLPTASQSQPAPAVQSQGTPQLGKQTRPPTPAQSQAQPNAQMKTQAQRAQQQAAIAAASRVSSPALSAAAVPITVSTSSPVPSAVSMARTRTFGSNQGGPVNGMNVVRPSFSPPQNPQNLNVVQGPGTPMTEQQMRMMQQQRQMQQQQHLQQQQMRAAMAGQNPMLIRQGVPGQVAMNPAQLAQMQAQQQQRMIAQRNAIRSTALQQAQQTPNWDRMPPEQQNALVAQIAQGIVNNRNRMAQAVQAQQAQQIAAAQQMGMGGNVNVNMNPMQYQQQQMMNMNGARVAQAAKNANMFIANARQPGAMQRMTPQQMQQMQQAAAMNQFQDLNGFNLQPAGRGMPMNAVSGVNGVNGVAGVGMNGVNGVNGMNPMNNMMGMNMGMGMPMGRGRGE